MIRLVLIFLGILLVVVGYMGMRINNKPKQKPIKHEENQDLKNAGIGTTKDILQQRATWENQFEQKPGEIFDNIFNGKIVGLLSS